MGLGVADGFGWVIKYFPMQGLLFSCTDGFWGFVDAARIGRTDSLMNQLRGSAETVRRLLISTTG